MLDRLTVTPRNDRRLERIGLLDAYLFLLAVVEHWASQAVWCKRKESEIYGSLSGQMRKNSRPIPPGHHSGRVERSTLCNISGIR